MGEHVLCSDSVELVTENLEKSLSENRSYRVVGLSHQLEVLLIHDTDTDKAAAAMDVNVGSLSDPEDVPETAHPVENFCFMGTKKARTNATTSATMLKIQSTLENPNADHIYAQYSRENEYSEYLAKYGGHSNVPSIQP